MEKVYDVVGLYLDPPESAVVLYVNEVSDCFVTTDLTIDHEPRAWKRKAEGMVIRLSDVEVVGGPCTSRADHRGPRAGDPRKRARDRPVRRKG